STPVSLHVALAQTSHPPFSISKSATSKSPTLSLHDALPISLALGLTGQDIKQIDPTDQRLQGRHAETGEPLPGLLRHEAEEVHRHLDGADVVVAAQAVGLGGGPGGAVVEVAEAQMLAAEGRDGRGAEARALGAEERRVDRVAAGLQAAAGLPPPLVPPVVRAQGLVGLREAQLPGGT